MSDLFQHKTFRFILSPCATAKENMAIDRALFESFDAQKDQPIIRLYTWFPSMTFGVSQRNVSLPSVDYLSHYGKDVAQRMTGGGILFHGHDISYSLILPASDFQTLSVKQGFEQLSSFLLTFYQKLGLDAHYAKEELTHTVRDEFCQRGKEEYDIIIEGKKIGGNAQKRTRRVIFQHGSIPIKTVSFQKEWGTSLQEWGISLDVKNAQERLLDAFTDQFNVTLTVSSLNTKEKSIIKKVLNTDETAYSYN